MESNTKTLKEEFDSYMKSYGFDKIENSDKWASASLGTPIKIMFPNIPARKDAVIYHDINHIITGFKAQTFIGEVQAAYFEIFSGCGKQWFGWCINSLALPFGIFIPHKAYQAIKLARKVKTNAYYENIEELWPLSIEEIRNRWGVN